MIANPSRYAALMREWAGRALDASEGARVYVDATGPSVALGAPAARAILAGDRASEAARASAEHLARLVRQHGLGPLKFTDTFGFSRPVYYPLLVHLHLLTAENTGDLASQLATRADPAAAIAEPPLRLWWALCLDEAGERLGDAALRRRAVELVDAIATQPGQGGSLHRREGLDDLADAWTFRELTGLHALAWMAIRTGRDDWRRRAFEVAAAHQDVTQPDYTTYQPWGVFAFLFAAETVFFAEQQLHDAVTNLHVEQGGAGLVPGLLLADAAAAVEAAAHDAPCSDVSLNRRYGGRVTARGVAGFPTPAAATPAPAPHTAGIPADPSQG